MKKFIAILILLMAVMPSAVMSGLVPGMSEQLNKEHEQRQALVEYLQNKYPSQSENIKGIVEEVYKKTLPGKFPEPIDVLSVIAVESKFNRKAVHPSGLYKGLMQLHVLHKVRNPFDVSENLARGVELLEEYEQGRGFNYAMVSFNAGPGAAKRICKPRSCQTQYVKKIEAEKRTLLEAMSST